MCVTANCCSSGSDEPRLNLPTGEFDVPLTLHIITGRVPDPILYFHTAKEHEETPRTMLAVSIGWPGNGQPANRAYSPN